MTHNLSSNTEEIATISIFEDIQFASHPNDKFTCKISKKSKSISIQLTNHTLQKIFSKTFTSTTIRTQTNCHLPIKNLHALLLNYLNSSSTIKSKCTIQYFQKQDIQKEIEFILNSATFPTLKPTKNDNISTKGDISLPLSPGMKIGMKPKMKYECLILIIHYAPDEYTQINMCFALDFEKNTRNRSFVEQKQSQEIEQLKEEMNRMQFQMNDLSKKYITLYERINDSTSEGLSLNKNVNSPGTLFSDVKTVGGVRKECIITELLNGWKNWNEVYDGDVKYTEWQAVKIGGVVHLQGCVTCGEVSKLPIAQLPLLWRPAGMLTFTFDQHTTNTGRLRVYNTGMIIAEYSSKAWVYLDGVSFVAVQ